MPREIKRSSILIKLSNAMKALCSHNAIIDDFFVVELRYNIVHPVKIPFNCLRMRIRRIRLLNLIFCYDHMITISDRSN